MKKSAAADQQVSSDEEMLTHILHDIQSKSQERGCGANNGVAGRTALVTKVFATKKKDDEVNNNGKTPRNEEAKYSAKESTNNLRDKRMKVVVVAATKPSEEPISHKSVQRHQKRIYNDRYDKHQMTNSLMSSNQTLMQPQSI
jgi:hypothetical protein